MQAKCAVLKFVKDFICIKKNLKRRFRYNGANCSSNICFVFLSYFLCVFVGLLVCLSLYILCNF